MSKEKTCPNCNGTGEMDVMVPLPGIGAGTTIKKTYCPRCFGSGTIPDDTPSDTTERRPITGNWIWDRLDNDILMSLLFLFLPFLGGAQELFRFTSTSQFICVDTSVMSDRQEWHTETEVYAEGSKFVLASRSESRPHTIYYNITWDIITPLMVRGHDPIGRVYEWHRTEDRREFNGAECITVEGENFARIYGGCYDFRFYESWWTLTIQKR